MKKFFAILAVATLAIVAPAQASANESNGQVASEQGFENIKQKAQEFIVRISELVILEDNAGLQSLQNEMMAYVATLSSTDQDAFQKAGDEYMARVDKIREKAIGFVDQLVAAIEANDQTTFKSVEKISNEYELSLNEADRMAYSRICMAYGRRLQRKRAQQQ